MKIKRKNNRKRNYLAKELWNPLFKHRVVPDKKKNKNKFAARGKGKKGFINE